jgi:SAM-dependent methyltransferase
MIQSKKKFSHVSNVTDYMRITVDTIYHFFDDDIVNKKILDIPAGNGWVSQELTNLGANTTPADINKEFPHFIQANMERRLPFEDEEFDAVACLEGIEHILHPEALFSELARVLKKGGLLIITTPNVQNFYSRYQLLCTGYLFQFDPFDKTPLKENEIRDKGHISPIFYTQLRYYSEMHGLKTLKPSGGRLKRIIALPFFIPFLLVGFYWSFRDWKKTSNKQDKLEIIKHLFSIKVLFSRSLIFKAVKSL